MPTQSIISGSQLAAMRDKVFAEPKTQNLYAEASLYPLPPDTRLLNTLIQLPENSPELQVTRDRAEDDFRNAIRIYEYLGPLDRTQAADPRLWTTLTHTTFWKYSQLRWPTADESPNFILTHWFERPGAGLGALRRNAISRLWWAAHLTVAPWERDNELTYLKSSDRYKFTRTLLSQAQIFQDILEREFGSNVRIRALLLNALSKHLRDVPNKDDLSKEVSKKLLLMLKLRHLDALPVAEADQIINALVQRAAEKSSKSSKLGTN
jgi:hypothetical protein